MGFNQVGQLLWQRFNAHETEYQSSHRIIFVVELDDAQMIHAFEHQLLYRLIARRTQSIGKATCVQGKPGKVLKGVEEQKRRGAGMDEMNRRGFFENIRIVAESSFSCLPLVVRHVPRGRQIVKTADRDHARQRLWR